MRGYRQVGLIGNAKRMLYPEVVRNAFQVALVVGIVLNLVNQGGALFGSYSPVWSQVLLNFFVPYCVASFSAVRVQSPDCNKQLRKASKQGNNLL